ncbi:MAG: hypothetical protein ACE5IL_00335 [Myxococcota bacterium]
MNVRRGALAAAMVALMGAGGLWLADRASAAPPDGRCRQEIRSLCPDVEGPRAHRQCIRAHADDLSQECRARLRALRERMKTVRRDCGDDVRSLCSDVERGHAAIRRCLRDNPDQLSDACAAHFERRDRL